MRDQTKRRKGRFLPALLMSAAVFVLPIPSSQFITPAIAQAVDMRAGIHEGFGRMVFEWDQRTAYTARISGSQLIVSFDRPVQGNPNVMIARLPGYVSNVKLEDGRKRLVFGLNGQFQLRPRAFGTSVILDLVRTGAAPAPQAAKKAAPKPKAVATPRVPVRVGQHKTYTRIVFDWPQRANYTVKYANGQATVRFSKPGVVNMNALRRALPQELKGVALQSQKPLAVRIPAKALPKHFRAGKGKNSVVIDIAKSAPAKPAPTAAKPTPKKTAQPVAKADPTKPAQTAKVAPKPQAKPKAKEPPKPKAVPVAKVESAPAAPTPQAQAAAQPGRVVSLSFSWDQPTGAAVFRRGGYIWAVFDRPHSLDTKLMRRMGKGVLMDVEQVRASGGTAVRILAPINYNPSLRREGLLWIVDIMAQTLRPQTPLRISPQRDTSGGVKWFIPLSEGGSQVEVVDPGIGDTMTVVPIIPLGHGVAKERKTVDTILPVTAQGVVVIPRGDDLKVASSRNGVDISRKGGLRLSGESTMSAALAVPIGEEEVSKAFDMKTWLRGGEDSFIDDRLALREAVMQAGAKRKNYARMDLARFFFAHGYAAEALGVLRSIEAENPQRKDQPDFLALRGGANYLMHRVDEAIKDLSHETLVGSTEAQLWRALAKIEKARTEKTEGELPGEDILTIRAASPVLKDYPERLRTRLALNAAEALVDAGDDTGARNYLDVAKRDEHSIQEEAEIAYLNGRLHASSGALDAAISDWEEAEETFVRPFRARAAYDRITLQRQMDEITADQAIEGLDRLRFAWRGDGFEYKLLNTLAELNLKSKRYGEGLRVLRQMVSYFRDTPESKDVADLMRTTFRELYLNGKADELSPVRAIGLYEEFRELTPPGKDGDEMIRKLADRLVSVDLLDQAAQLLEHQVDARLKGQEQSKVGARLALVYLLNKKPSLTLAALKKTEGKNLPKDLVEQRAQLRARALADLGQSKNALTSLATSNSDESNLLKAEIQWRAQDWAGAADSLSRSVHQPEPGTQMSEDMRKRVLQWATALRLSDQRRDIALLRRDFLKHMNATAEFDAFNLLTSQTTSGLIDMEAVEAQIKQAESFRSFMSDYKDKMKSQGLSAIN